MSQLRVTVVVVPRESFNMTVDVVNRIYAVTSPIFKLIVMEGHAPESVRAQLREIERTKPNCKIVYSDRWYYPHELVNQSMPLIDTEYVVYIDNDVEVMEGCVEELVACADETKAGCVHPVYLTETLKKSFHKIHVAEGKLIKRMQNGYLFLDSTMPYSGTSYDDYPGKDHPKPSDFFEWHCVMFRKSLLDKVGPLDDLNISEHLDYTLRIVQAGEKIMLAPKAAGAYDYERIFKFRGADRKYMLYRWGVAKSAESLERFCKTWNLHPDSAKRRLHWVKEHTGKVAHTYLVPRVVNKIRRTVGMPNMPFCREPKPVMAGLEGTN